MAQRWGHARQHSGLINLPGVKHIFIGSNKLDCETTGYKQVRRMRLATR